MPLSQNDQSHRSIASWHRGQVQSTSLTSRWLSRLPTIASILASAAVAAILFNELVWSRGLQGRSARTPQAAALSEMVLRWDLDDVTPAFNLTFPMERYRVIHVHSSLEDYAIQDRGSAGQRYISTAYSLTRPGEVQYVDHYQFGTLDIREYASIECTLTFRGVQATSRVNIEWYDKENYATIVNCPIPADLNQRLQDQSFLNDELHVDITWRYRDAQGGSYTHHFMMKNRLTPSSEDLGICLSPIYGHADARELLGWRENARSLGISVVHWNARDPSVADFVDKYNRATGSHDTFMHAPPMDPYSYLKGKNEPLRQSGKYGDQVLYYLKCKMHSMSNSPTRWFALTDKDENFFPAESDDEDTLVNPQLIDELDSLPANVGAACMPRTFHSGIVDLAGTVSPSVLRTDLPVLAHIKEFASSRTSNQPKCIYRSAAFELASVHSPVRLKPGYRKQGGAQLGAILLHWHGTAEKTDRTWTPSYTESGLRRLLADRWIGREQTWERMNWGCRKVPCE